MGRLWFRVQDSGLTGLGKTPPGILDSDIIGFFFSPKIRFRTSAKDSEFWVRRGLFNHDV